MALGRRRRQRPRSSCPWRSRMTSSTVPKPRNKFSVVPLIKDHYGTFKAFDSGQIVLMDYLIFNAVLLVSDLSVRAGEVNQTTSYQQAVKRLAQELRANISYAVLLGLTL